MIRIKDKVEFNTTRVVFTETVLHREELDIDVLMGEFDSYHCVDCGEARLFDNFGTDHGIINIVQRIQRHKKETDLQGNVKDVEFFSYIFEKEIDLASYDAEFAFNGRDESRRQLMMNCYGSRIKSMVLLWLKIVVPEGRITDFTAKGHLTIIKFEQRPMLSLDTYPFMRRTIIEYLRHRVANDG